MLVQSARMDARIAATNAVLGLTRQATDQVVRSGSFTDPEYGRVGLTETEAAAHHDGSWVSRATTTCCARSRTAGQRVSAS